MTKDKKVTVKTPVRAAAAVRQVLFEAQREYSHDHVPERIVELREVNADLDEAIGAVVE